MKTSRMNSVFLQYVTKVTLDNIPGYIFVCLQRQLYEH